MRTRSPRSQDGSALILALIFITVFSLIIAALLSFSEVGLRAAASAKSSGRRSEAIDGAVNAAVNQFRRGGPCDDYRAPMVPGPGGQLQPLYGLGVIVRCVDDNRPASGRATRPVNALLSLGSDGITTAPGFEQRIAGNVFSNTTLKTGVKADGTVQGAPLTVQGQVSAAGDCSPAGTIQTTPPTTPVTPLHCANTGGGADPSQGRDPDYTKALTAVPVRRTVPACPANPAWLVELKPGYYDDATALNALTTGACPNKVVWLEPGNYYFDFTFRSGPGTWTIDDPTVNVVAGTPKGWSASPTGPNPTPLTVPGSCDTATGAAGVEVVAGGGTQLDLKRGRAEVCAEPSTSDQSIALYGMADDRTHTLEPNDWTGVSGFSNPGGATTIGEVPTATTTAALAAGPTSTAALTLTTLRPGVPAGSLVDSVALRVAHQEDGDMDGSSTKVEVGFPDSTCTGAQALAVPVSIGALVELRIDDLKGKCGLRSPADLNGAAITYTTALKAGGTTGTGTLDGVALEVAYRAPTTFKPTTISANTGFGGEANALEIAEQPDPPTADATLNGGAATASITVAGVGEPPIPPGSTIDSAALRVAHRDQGDLAPPTVTVPFTGSTCTAKALPLRAAGIADDRVDLKACGLDDAAKLVGLTATYDVSLAPGGITATDNLDGMWLELVYRPPPLSRPAATVTTTGFAGQDNAKVIGEQPTPLTADADLNAGNAAPFLAFNGYDQPSAVPVDSVVDSAVLRVAHHETGASDAPTLALTFSGTTCPTPALTRRTTGEDRIDLKACGLNDPAQLVGLSATYTAHLTGGVGTAKSFVDGVVLDLGYRPPVSRRPTSVITTSPGFAPVDNAKAIGGPTADATLAGSPAAAAVTGFAPVPPGSVVDKAVLRVAHQEDAFSGPLSLSIPNSTCAAGRFLPPSPGAIAVDRIDLGGCGLTTPEQLAGLAATYTASPPTPITTRQTPVVADQVTTFTTASANEGRAIDGTSAEAPLSSPDAMSASIRLSGYTDPPAPPGWTIGSATLRVVHKEDPGVEKATTTVAFTGGTCAPAIFGPRPSLFEDTIDLKACGLTDPAKLADLAVTYSPELAAGASPATASLDGAVVDITYLPPPVVDRLDGIELDVVFRAPALRPLDGCLTTGTGCALLKVEPAAGDTATRFSAQGSIYAPTGALDISMAGLKSQVLARGLVARTIRLGLKADAGFRRPVLGVPPEPVKFTAYPDVRARATNPVTTGFNNPSNALDIGEKPAPLVADAALTPASPSASVTLDQVPAPPLPGTLDGAVLRVAHREDAGIGSVQVDVTFTGIQAGGCTFQLPSYESPAASPGPLGEDQIDLAACGLNDPADLADLKVTYTVALPATPSTAASAYLDGVTLDLLSGPMLRARVAFDAGRDQADVQGWSVVR